MSASISPSVFVFLERCLLDGLYVTAIVFGILTTVAWDCLAYSIKGRRLSQIKWPIVSFTVVMYAAACICMGSWAKLLDITFIETAANVGADESAAAEATAPTYLHVPLITYAVMNFMADALLLYRCFIMWNRRWLVIAVPLVMYMADVVIGSLATNQEVHLNTLFFSLGSADLVVPWLSLSTSLNVVLTGIITARLLSARNRLRAVLGYEHSKLYTSVTTMLVESASLYTFSSLFIISAIAVGNTGAATNSWYLLSNAFGLIHTMITAICPLLIISRVARGQAFSEEGISSLRSTIRFRSSEQRMNGSRTANVDPLSASRDIKLSSTTSKPFIAVPIHIQQETIQV